MHHHVYANSDKYPIVLLIKKSAFKLDEIETSYIEPLEARGINRADIIVVALEYNDKGKAPAIFMDEFLSRLMPNLEAVSARYVYCADANYFKKLAKQTKAVGRLGYSFKCGIKGHQTLEITLGVNHRSLLYNPANEPDLILSVDTLASLVNGTYEGLGINIIKACDYPTGPQEIRAALDRLHQYPYLSADLETGSLDFDKAGIGTMTFCSSKHEGIAFACDYVPNPLGRDEYGRFGKLIPNLAIRAEIKRFLLAYTGRLRWHNAPYDLSILIYELWMENLLDNKGQLEGLHHMTRSFDDTKIIAYLSTNSTAGNHLKLKELAHAFAGNWAQDEIKDITRIPLPELLQYNLIDGLATNYVYEKHYPLMVQDAQEEIYLNLMLPSQKTIIQMETTGMPMDKKQIYRARKELEKILAGYETTLDSLPLIVTLNKRLQADEMNAVNAKLKVKQHPIEEFKDFKFNPASPNQVRKLVYDQMALPIIGRTKTGLSSTKGKILKRLMNHTTNQDYLDVLEALMGIAVTSKILTSFIPAFEKAIDKSDLVVWLHGSFNLGGTVSGRLSSSNPNMQNIPSGSTYAKLIKACFVAPKGWLMGGADFNSLEDYISALTTRDPNKMKVYLDGYDGHSVRAFKYFPEKLPGIVDTVESINSIQTLFPQVRSDSKAPTFLLTYGGTYHGMKSNLGWDEDKAKKIEEDYHELYKVSDEWVQTKLQEARSKGYVEVAFGLRLRTPLLSQTIGGHRTTPYEAEAEGRTAGNALGQSYGLLNNRAANKFMEKVWASPYSLRIKIIAQIHDAIYLIMEDDIDVVAWVNQHLIDCMQWQDLPELEHYTVKLGASLSIFWPSWKDEVVIPNNASYEEIRSLTKQHMDEHQEPRKEAA
jgi:DNA polymerase-1